MPSGIGKWTYVCHVIFIVDRDFPGVVIRADLEGLGPYLFY